VQLHQLLLAWNHHQPTQQSLLRAAILGRDLEISHLCGNKTCANVNHLCAETSSSTTNVVGGCPVVIFINEKMFMCCKCQPACVPTAEKVHSAIRYTV